MKSIPISPEKLAEARDAAKHHNEALDVEIITPEFLEEALKRIDVHLPTKWHNEVLAVIAMWRAEVVIYDPVNVKRLGLIITAPKLFRRQVKASNSADDDDHDSNLLVNTPRGPAYKCRGPVFFNTNDYAW